MELIEYVDEATFATLRRLLPDAPLQPLLTPVSGSRESSVSTDLPLPVGADYRFNLYLRPERQIHARLLNADPNAYFWYMPFEDAAFKYSVEALDAAFLQTIEHLVQHETRIIQRRGLLSHSFKCEYKSGHEWKGVYSHSGLRFGGFHAPQILTRTRVYISAAIVPRLASSV